MPLSLAFGQPLETHVGGGLLYGTRFLGAQKDGVGLQLFTDVRLLESLSLSFAGSFTSHRIGSGNTGSLTNLGLGLLFDIDVLIVVPFVSARLGWLHWDPSERSSSSGLGFGVAVGLDYRWTENFGLGFSVEYLTLLTNFHSFPAYVAFVGRVGFRLGD